MDFLKNQGFFYVEADKLVTKVMLRIQSLEEDFKSLKLVCDCPTVTLTHLHGSRFVYFVDKMR